MRLPLVLALIFGTAFASGARAQVPADVEHWHIDPARSQARFRVRLFGVVPIGGWFDRFEGEVGVDRVRGIATVSATLDATKVRMNRPSHTTWAKSPEFFHADAHPSIRFVSLDLPLSRLTDGGRIDGTLTLRGITRKVEFRLDDADCALDEDSICRVVVTGAVDRSDFGMTTRRGTVADRVSFTLRLVAERT